MLHILFITKGLLLQKEIKIHNYEQIKKQYYFKTSKKLNTFFILKNI